MRAPRVVAIDRIVSIAITTAETRTQVPILTSIAVLRARKTVLTNSGLTNAVPAAGAQWHMGTDARDTDIGRTRILVVAFCLINDEFALSCLDVAGIQGAFVAIVTKAIRRTGAAGFT